MCALSLRNLSALKLPRPLIRIIIEYDNRENEETKSKCVAELMAFRDTYFWVEQSHPSRDYRSYFYNKIQYVALVCQGREGNSQTRVDHYNRCLKWYLNNPKCNGITHVGVDSILCFEKETIKAWRALVISHISDTVNGRDFKGSVLLDEQDFWFDNPD